MIGRIILFFAVGLIVDLVTLGAGLPYWYLYGTAAQLLVLFVKWDC